MRKTGDELDAAARTLYRAAAASPDEVSSQRLHALGDAVHCEAEKIRARICGLDDSPSQDDT
jgi:hypothetical protein